MKSIFREIKGYLIKQIFIIVDLDCKNKIILFSASRCARIEIWVSTYAHFSPESCCNPSFGSNLSAGAARAPTHFIIHWHHHLGEQVHRHHLHYVLLQYDQTACICITYDFNALVCFSTNKTFLLLLLILFVDYYSFIPSVLNILVYICISFKTLCR